MSDPMATFVVEYPCDRRCQVELDLSDIGLRFTHGQMLRAAEDEPTWRRTRCRRSGCSARGLKWSCGLALCRPNRSWSWAASPLLLP